MTDYVKSTNFAAKDALAVGNPLKIVKGTEIDEEFNNIAIAVATKANSVSPTLTGVPLAPTAATGTNTTQLATTAFVQAATTEAKVSPALTGTPTAPTASVNTNTTQLATTAFVAAQIADDAPTKTGTGASGSWGISITGSSASCTGNAATVSTLTAAQVGSAITGMATGDVGTYAFLRWASSSTIAAGATAAGSDLRYSGINTDGSGNTLQTTGATPSGTWRAMGSTTTGYANGSSTLWLRIS